MPNGEHIPRPSAAQDAGDRGGDARGSCLPGDPSGRITAGSDGCERGTTVAEKFGAEGVRDLRLGVQMAVHATPTELERLAQERDALVAWLARQFPHSLSLEDAEDLVATALPILAADPRLPGGGRRRHSFLRRALHHDAVDEL